jgi:hypothetical protein
MRRQVLVGLGVVLLAGCSGLGAVVDGGSADQSWEYRIVVESGYSDARNVTVSVDTDAGALNETKQLAPGEQWVVTTLTDDDAGSGTYAVAVSTAQNGDEVTHEAQTAGSGVTRIVLGEGRIVSCGGNVTCYQ